jgi:hypothetical protein
MRAKDAAIYAADVGSRTAMPAAANACHVTSALSAAVVWR